MNTPIFDFVKKYSESDFQRLHMPGHKGQPLLGCEHLDITEIKGADALYEAEGIIAESEKNAAELFGSARTLYSAEGSSLSIKTMLYLALMNRTKTEKRPVILAARNVHKSFVYGCGLLDIDVEWLYGEDDNFSLCRCIISPESIEREIKKHTPFAVYLTTPDYLGGMLDVKKIAEVCKKFNTPLLIDNAHGAYLKFLPESRHPMDLGADMCCDSAHKTLPALTGAGYLHIKNEKFAKNAKNAMEIFGSTSPSYLILQSLDLCNKVLAGNYKDELANYITEVDRLKYDLTKKGWNVLPSDPLKLTIESSGIDLAEKLRQSDIEVEYEDPDFTVLMFTPCNGSNVFDKIKAALGENKNKFAAPHLTFECHARAMSIRKALFSESETIDVANSVGRILSSPTVGCPPAVPVVVSGEIICKNDLEIFKHYGIDSVKVIKE